jgi:hypothetical protein
MLLLAAHSALTRPVLFRRIEAASIRLLVSMLVVDNRDLKRRMEIDSHGLRPKGFGRDLANLILSATAVTIIVGLTILTVGCGDVAHPPQNEQVSRQKHAHVLTAKGRKEVSDRCRQLRRHVRKVNREPAQTTPSGVVAKVVAVKCH